MRLNHLLTKSLLLNESLLDVRRKNASQLSDNIFQKLLSYDPFLYNIDASSEDVLANTPESYIRWLLKMNKKGELSDNNVDTIREALKTFDYAKKRRNLLPNNDINSYQTIDELLNAISQINDNLTINQKNKDAKRNQKELKKELQPGMYLNGGAELLYINDDWEVWTPHTYEGSKALRRGACWCTGGDTPNYYNSYTEEGQLFIIINRKDNSEKYQLFVPFEGYDARHEKEFRDKNNDSLRFRNFVHENGLVDFFMTQDNVTASYEDLDNPDVDDEWDDEREEDIMYEYDVSYDDYTGEIYMNVPYQTLVNRTYYTSPEDYQDMASHGYLEDGIQGNLDKYISDVIRQEEFLTEINWEDTDLMMLYEFFKKDSGLTEYSFEDFITTLFAGAAHYPDDMPVKQEIFTWLNERPITSYGAWEHSVRMAISTQYLDQPYVDYIYSQLHGLGWEPERHSRTNYDFYIGLFEDGFHYIFNDCHSIEEFYHEYTNDGQNSIRDILYNNNIEINEEEGDINLYDCDWDNYSKEWASDDAKNIVDIFMTTKEWNEFLSSYEEENNEDNTKINVSKKGNHYIFYDEGALFSISSEQRDAMVEYYQRWKEFNCWGYPFEIIHRQIEKYPTSYIKDILLKYGDLNENNRGFLEKVDDNQTINSDYITSHLSSFIENTLKDFVLKEVGENDEKQVDESLFDTDW